jgi:hypothetical protein
MVLWVLFYHQVQTNGGNAIKLFSQIILNVRCQPLDFTVTSIYYIFVKKPASCLMAQRLKLFKILINLGLCR